MTTDNPNYVEFTVTLSRRLLDQLDQAEERWGEAEAHLEHCLFHEQDEAREREAECMRRVHFLRMQIGETVAAFGHEKQVGRSWAD